jgi:hypothetical protein
LADKIFQVCDAGKWTTVSITGEKGDKGEQGEAGQNTSTTVNNNSYSTVFLFDANDQKIGYPILINRAETNYTDINVILLDGKQLEVVLETGPVFNNNDFFNSCFYTSTDCSGDCYSSSKPKPNYAYKHLEFLVHYNGGTPITRLMDGSMPPINLTARSYYWDGSCRATTNTANFYPSTAYNPIQFVYPFALPLKFKPSN